MRLVLSVIPVLFAAAGVSSVSGASSICGAVPGNLVWNCGFETGDLSNWSFGGNTTNPPGGFNGSEYGVDFSDANSGSSGLYIGPIGSVMNFYQNLTLVAGTQYNIAFFVSQNAAAVVNSNHTFSATIQNIAQSATLATLQTLNNPAATGYVQYTATFTPTSGQLGGAAGQVALVFSFRNDDSYWSLDDVSVAPNVTLVSPTISKAFSPTIIQAGGSSTVTLTLSNSNASTALTGGAFSDALANMSAAGGSVTGTCIGTTPASLSAGATGLSFSNITIPANGNCTVIFSVTSTTPGVLPNSTSGVTTTQTPTAGSGSNIVNLTVNALTAPTISKAFSPATIPSGGSSTVTLTLSNSNPSTALTGGTFTDTLANMSAAGGSVTGTCTGTTPASLSASATGLSFSNITIPANGSCTVIFSVTSSTPGVQPNSTSGVTTTQTPTAGSGSNTANLTVGTLAVPTISKAFSPTSIAPGGSSTVTLTLSNSNPSTALTGGGFTDTLANMSAAGGNVTGTCTGTTPASLNAGTTLLTFSNITIPANGSCTVIFSVTSSTQGVQPNSTSGVTTTQTPTAGPGSNTANLTVGTNALSAPAISKVFSPTSIPSGGVSTVTLTLSNSNPSTTLTGGAFTDTLANMSAAGGSVTGTCTGTAPASLNAGATGPLNFSNITIPANGNCTVIFSVTSSTPGVQPNSTSGVTTTQTPTPGSGSNIANLTVGTTAPPAPTITSPANGFSRPPNYPLNVGGTAIANASITIYDNNSSIATGTADSTGHFSISITLALGSHSLKATQTVNGITSAASNVVNGTIQTGPPPPVQSYQDSFEQGYTFFNQGVGVVRVRPSGSTTETDYAPGIEASDGSFYARLAVQPGNNINNAQTTVCSPGALGVKSFACVGPLSEWGLPYGGLDGKFDTGIPISGSSQTSIEIYLDTKFAATAASNTQDYRFDWDSSLLDRRGVFLQDYVFNVATAVPPEPSGCTNGFVIEVSTNSQRSGGGNAHNPAGQVCITTSGWYGFSHLFRRDAVGNLVVDMAITTISDNFSTVASWTLHPTCPTTQAAAGLCTSGQPLPFSAVGSNFEGSFPNQEINDLAVDNIARNP